ncbi:MAG: hypothetical protein OXR68_03000 [Alphaproteobacteria bacterium]|nr:hypothetical protein [Alphaproteobacteria bacterium]MDD9919572.1 hypothetical protein [Alphaproteobacteria bacterium]
MLWFTITAAAVGVASFFLNNVKQGERLRQILSQLDPKCEGASFVNILRSFIEEYPNINRLGIIRNWYIKDLLNSLFLAEKVRVVSIENGKVGYCLKKHNQAVTEHT